MTLTPSVSDKQCGPGRRWCHSALQGKTFNANLFVFVQLHLVCSHEMDKDWCGAAAVLASAKDRYEHGKHFAVSRSSFTSLVPILSLEFSRTLCVLPQCVSLGTNNQMRASGREWVLANTNISGYYRVNYDLDNWDRLLTLLDNNHRVSHKCFQRERDWCCFFLLSMLI